jgi:hypothetical protein
MGTMRTADEVSTAKLGGRSRRLIVRAQILTLVMYICGRTDRYVSLLCALYNVHILKTFFILGLYTTFVKAHLCVHTAN